MNRTASFGALLLGLSWAASAHADTTKPVCHPVNADARTATDVCAWDEGYARVPDAEVHPYTWYGVQTLIADLVVAGVSATAIAIDYSSGPTWGKSLLFVTPLPFLSGPVVHWAHGNVWRGFASFGARAVLIAGIPALATWADNATRPSGTTFSPWGVAIGVPLGFILSAALDAGVLSRVPRDAPRAASLTLTPTVSPLRDGASLGMVGAF